MVKISHPEHPEEARQSAKHTLYVEGSNDESFDPTMLTILLPQIRVQPLGSSFHIRSAAEALYQDHPFYYFLIDRDHYNDRFVNDCWDNFPDPNKSNLLIWRRREFENYFLDLDYLMRSQYLEKSLKCNEAGLREKIVSLCTKRIYMDTVNRVLVSIREEQKQTWIKPFSNPSEFTTANASLGKLLNKPELVQRKDSICDNLEKESLKTRFYEYLEEATEGIVPLVYGKGRWLELLKGKPILKEIINSCFKVIDTNGEPVQGKDKIKIVIKDLLKKELKDQPKDFQQLHGLIDERISSSF